MAQAIHISGIPDGEVEALAEIYRKAAARLRGIILEPPGKTAYTQSWQVAWASQRLAQVEGTFADLRRRAVNWVSDKRDGSSGPVRKAMQMGIEKANQQAKDAKVDVSGSPFGGSFGLVDDGTVRVFARAIARDLYKAADGMKGTAKSVLTRTKQEKLSESEIHKILAGGIISGKPTQTIRELREALKVVHGEEVTIPTENGPMHFEAGYYARLVASTQMREASEHARHERLGQVGIDLVRVIGRVSKNFCTAYLGMVFSISGKDGRYPPLKSLPRHGPPFHPNCSKSTAPFMEALASPRQLENAGGTSDQQLMVHQGHAQPQKSFNYLQLHTQIKDRYVTTEKKLVGNAPTRKEELEQAAAAARYERAKKIMGDKLQVDGDPEHMSETQRRHIEDMAKVSDDLLARAVAAGLKFRIGDTSVGDAFPEKKGQPVKGQAGVIWDQIGGVYRPKSSTVFVGKGVASHNTDSLFIHELGHGLGDKLRYNHHPDLASIHEAIYGRLNPYHQQGLPRGPGRREMLADGLATFLTHGDGAVAAEYGPEFALFLRRLVKGQI